MSPVVGGTTLGGVLQKDDEVTAPPARPGSGLLDRHVVLAPLAGRSLRGLRSALAGSGARTLEVGALGDVRRHAAVLGSSALLVVDVPDNVEPVRLSLGALGGHDAVVLLSCTATRAQRIVLLCAGADHVLDTDEPDEVIACLLAVLRRVRRDRASRVADRWRVGELCLDLKTRLATTSGRCLALTTLEFQLLAYFMAKAGQALTREQLLADVWGYDVGGLDTVTVHVRRLRMKIEVDPSRPVRLRTVWGTGYRLETEPDTPTTIPARLSVTAI